MGTCNRCRNPGGIVLSSEVTPENVQMAKLMCHLKNPHNLMTYLVFSAWLKFMGVAQHLPSITVG